MVVVFCFKLYVIVKFNQINYIQPNTSIYILQYIAVLFLISHDEVIQDMIIQLYDNDLQIRRFRR